MVVYYVNLYLIVESYHEVVRARIFKSDIFIEKKNIYKSLKTILTYVVVFNICGFSNIYLERYYKKLI